MIIYIIFYSWLLHLYIVYAFITKILISKALMDCCKEIDLLSNLAETHQVIKIVPCHWKIIGKMLY